MSRPFNQKRYMALLEGLEITVLPLSDLNLGDRADAEFYSKEIIEIEQSLRHHEARPLSEFCKLVASAFYPAATQLYETGDVPFARCVDCVKFPIISKIQDEEFERIPRWFIEQCGQINTVFRGDIILSKVGSPCFASVVHDYDEVALSRTVLGLVQIRQINSYYLTAFLRCRYGFNQLLRQREQTIQYQLTLDRVRELLVFVPSLELQQAVERGMLELISKLQEADTLQAQAEQTLLRALGLEGWQPPEPLTYTRKASEALSANRLDSEHFQPKYDAVIARMKSQGLQIERLGDLIEPLLNGWDCRQFVETGTPYIRVGDVKDCRIKSESAEHVAIDMSDIGKEIGLRVGDVLFTRKGSFGNAAPVRPGEEACIISSEIMLIRRKKEWFSKLLPEFLAVYFNSIAGSLQSEQWAHGVAFYSISQGDLERFAIPILPLKTQEAIAKHLEAAHTARHTARELLDRAKRAVEIAIEQGEAAALKLLHQ